MTAIRLDCLRKEFGQFVAVHDVNLEVRQGEFLTILGPSGSGKTTLLSLVAGLTDATSGRMYLGGRDVTREPPQTRNIGLVFQSYALFPHMTVARNVEFPLNVRGWERKKKSDAVHEALELMQLGHLAHRRPGSLSGGQQQRVALARAIVFQPEILLLDEPLGALDKKLRDQLQVELKQLQRRLGITALLVTHDQEEALSLGDRVMVLNDGKVQQIDSPSAAYLKPANRFVAEFLGTANFVPSPPTGQTGVIRPERVVLSMQASKSGARAQGCIKDMVYLGQSIRYHVETAEGHKFVCSSPSVGPAFQPGQQVDLHWQDTDVWLMN